MSVWYENDSKALEMTNAKYKHLNAEIMELTGGLEPKHFGFVMGARGKWLGMNNRLRKFLGIERFNTFAQMKSRLTLSLTLELLQLFSVKRANNCKTTTARDKDRLTHTEKKIQN
ncbi:hypothetical protein chiPu_0018303 [Chiloscyllium punctatum]|uniref:Uncharacterized protein n=1 Tax=Chiloscyllium punctatum TaxID=137246 RepID=A0A401RMI0_CHIPU|nr:hypothetical protein [Chiloscyllium punctatum]